MVECSNPTYSSGNHTPHLLILSPMPYPPGYMLLGRIHPNHWYSTNNAPELLVYTNHMTNHIMYKVFASSLLFERNINATMKLMTIDAEFARTQEMGITYPHYALLLQKWGDT